MPRYSTSLNELTEMQRGVGLDEIVDVWPMMQMSTVQQLNVGDLIAVKWHKSLRSHEFTWCTILAHTPIDATTCKVTLMHEQAAPGHITYDFILTSTDHSTVWLVFNFDNAAEHQWNIHRFVSQVSAGTISYTNFHDCNGDLHIVGYTGDYQCLGDCCNDDGVIPELRISSLRLLPGDFETIVPDEEVGADYNKYNVFIINDDEAYNHTYTDEEQCVNFFSGCDDNDNSDDYYGGWY